MSDMRMSPNLALNQLVAQRQAAGEPLIHLGFGESRLPAFGPLVERLAKGATRNAYGPVAGSPGVRAAAAGYFERRRIPTDPEQIVVAPGSKPLLMAINLAVPGDVLLPRPAWNTYAPRPGSPASTRSPCPSRRSAAAYRTRTRCASACKRPECWATTRASWC